MTLIHIQVTRSKVSVKGQAFSLYFGEGGISVLQRAILKKFCLVIIPQLETCKNNMYYLMYTTDFVY